MIKRDRVCWLQSTDIEENCFKIKKVVKAKTSRIIPIHQTIQLLVNKLVENSEGAYLLRHLKPVRFDGKRLFYFSKRQTRLRKIIGLPDGVVFNTLRDTFATRMENLGVPRNHMIQLLGHENGNMRFDVYSSGYVIDPLRLTKNKLTYGFEIDLLIKSLFLINLTLLSYHRLKYII